MGGKEGLYLGVQKPAQCASNDTTRAHSGFRTFGPTSSDAQEGNGWYLILLCMYLPPKTFRAIQITVAFHLALLTIKPPVSKFRKQA